MCALALLTMLAAFSVGFMALFGKTLIAAAAVWLVWPLLFSPQFTLLVFGAEKIVFWKVLLAFLALDLVVRLLFRRVTWLRR